MNLTCVKCTSVLDRTRIDDVEVDHCPRCGGLWLDHGEVERLGRKMQSDMEKLTRLLSPRKGPPPVPTELTVHCPACTNLLKEVALGTLHVDFCSRCKGVWLDRGELDAALATLKDAKATLAQVIATAAAAAPDA
jgi:Zn-finger nucleic acid-binding protein